MTAWVRRAKGKSGAIPRWMGGRMPLSTELAAAVRATCSKRPGDGVFAGPEMEAVRPHPGAAGALVGDPRRATSC